MESRPSERPAEDRSAADDWASSLTHGLAALLAVAGSVALVILASLRGSVWHVASACVYGATLVLLFTASTLYHSFRSPRVKRALRIVDHGSIYLLIAGTYTPFLLVNLRGPWGWSLFGCVWGLALTGIALKIFFTGRFRLLSTVFYLLMGWLVVIAIKPLLDAVPRAGILWLLAGGLLYSVGTIFYLWKRLPYGHAIWHLFVFAAGACHYVAIARYVMWPPSL